MAVLPDGARVDVWTDLMRRYSDNRLPCGVTKADLRAAVNAIDQFLSDNAVAINTAIPQPARAALTTEQKAILLMFVINRRYLEGS